MWELAKTVDLTRLRRTDVRALQEAGLGLAAGSAQEDALAPFVSTVVAVLVVVGPNGLVNATSRALSRAVGRQRRVWGVRPEDESSLMAFFERELMPVMVEGVVAGTKEALASQASEKGAGRSAAGHELADLPVSQAAGHASDTELYLVEAHDAGQIEMSRRELAELK